MADPIFLGNEEVSRTTLFLDEFYTCKEAKILRPKTVNRGRYITQESIALQLGAGTYDLEYLKFLRQDRKINKSSIMLRKCRDSEGKRNDCFYEHRLTFSLLGKDGAHTGHHIGFILQWALNFIEDQYYYEAAMALVEDGKVVEKQRLRIRYRWHWALEQKLQSFAGIYVLLAPGRLRDAVTDFIPCQNDGTIQNFEQSYRKLRKRFWKRKLGLG